MKKSIIVLTIVALTIVSCTMDDDPAGGTGAQCGGSATVGILFDVTGSMRLARTTPAKAEQLRPLIDTLSECGSELAVGFIRDEPDAGMRRLRFEVPPVIPELEPKGEMEPDYEYQDRAAARDAAILDRGATIQRGRENREAEIVTFLDGIQSTLNAKASKRTDFNSAMNQADIFLSEGGGGAARGKKFLIVVSDAIDNAKRSRLELTSGATLVWVNSNSDKKAISNHKVLRFESFPSAVLFVGQEVRR